MARFVYGDSFGDVANREMGMDAARDSRYFQSLAANRSAQAQRMAQAQAEASNRLSWEQLLAQAALSSRGRNDDLAQRQFSNRLRQGEFDQGVTSSAQHQSNVLEDLALRKRGMELQYGPEQESDRALSRFEKVANYFADDPSVDERSIPGVSRMNPEAQAMAKLIFGGLRRDVINEDVERGNVTNTTNERIAQIQRSALATETGPTITQDTVPPAAGTRGRFNTFIHGGNRVSPDDVEPYKAKVLANIMAGEFDEDLPAMPAKEAASVFRDVNRNQALSMSPYDPESGRFQFTPRFSTPQANGVANPSFGSFREGQIIYRQGVPYRVVNGQPVPLQATQ